MEKNIVKTQKAVKPSTTVDLFKDRKDIPDFLVAHPVFKSPHKFSKIFPSIGLSNFRETCELVKPLVDLKKENFVSALLLAMFTGITNSIDAATRVKDKLQFKAKPEERVASKDKREAIYHMLAIAKGVAGQIDTYDNSFEKVVQNSEGKIVLKLYEDVADASGKIVYKKDVSLFKIFGRLKALFNAQDIAFYDLENANEFKTFGIENVPNKNYQVVFSSDGSDGAWDILTMSMRGIKSCQRWDGDYPRCLIGSVVSKYVGIIYITSGSDIEFTCALASGNVAGKGLKMMRRAIVRYAIDADENKPCLLIEKLYPQQAGAEVDTETLNVFKKALSSKTTLPVYFAPQLGAKAKHFYIPFEKIRQEVSERDWTYQDTPLKTSLDFKLQAIASSNSDDSNRYLSLFRLKLVTKMTEEFRNVLANRKQVDSDIAKAISNIKLNSTLDRFSDNIAKLVVDKWQPNTTTSMGSQEYYRSCLISFLMNLKNIKKLQNTNLTNTIGQFTSREVNIPVIIDFIFDKIIKPTAYNEIKSLIAR